VTDTIQAATERPVVRTRNIRRFRRLPLRVVALLYVALLVGLPVGYLFVKAFSSGFGAFWSQITQPGALDALELSAKVAAIVVPVNAIVGVGAGLLLARRRFIGKRLLDLTFDVPIAVSPIIIGLSLFLAYSRVGAFGPWLLKHGIMILFSVPGIVIVTMAVSLPYVLRSIVPVLVEIGETQEIAARTLGAGMWRRLFTITLPAIRWALMYGIALTLARALGEFGAVIIVSGNITDKTQTLPIYIFSALDQPPFNVVGAFAGAVVLAAISISVLVILSILRARERRLRVDIA
jgi:sulfate transport system permease protein